MTFVEKIKLKLYGIKSRHRISVIDNNLIEIDCIDESMIAIINGRLENEIKKTYQFWDTDYENNNAPIILYRMYISTNAEHLKNYTDRLPFIFEAL